MALVRNGSPIYTRQEVADIVGFKANIPNGIMIIEGKDGGPPTICLSASSTDKRYFDHASFQNQNQLMFSFREQTVKKNGKPYKRPKPFDEHGPCFENKKIFNLLQKYQELKVTLIMKFMQNEWGIYPEPLSLRNAEWNSVTKQGHFMLSLPTPSRSSLNITRRLEIREVEEEE